MTGLPLAAEDFFKSKGIHVAFNCQKLLPNWIDMITNSGTCDIMFRSKADLEAYRAFDTNWKPFLISRISGQASLVESKPNEVAFHEQLGPFRLSLYNLSFTSEDTVLTLLRDNGITTSGYEVLVNGARQTHRIGFSDDNERLKTTLLLGGKAITQTEQRSADPIIPGCGVPS